MSAAMKPVALVTGASRGIGRTIAVELAGHGYHVLVNFRREQQEAEKTAALIAQAGGTSDLCCADLAQPAQVAAMFAGLSRLDLLVNNAGVTRDELFLTMRRESWDGVIKTNLNAVFHCSQLAAGLMSPARRGVIIHIGSSSAFSARIGQANYSTAKSALVGMTIDMARELAPYGVRVNLVAPGFTVTDMAGAVPDAAAQASLNRIPLRRWGQPEEVARAVAFLAGDAASGHSGQTWMVDGGRTAFEIEVGL